jgi:hypothetical protein
MDPREFLAFAKDLLDATPDAVACRTAIGRSYYAAPNVVMSMLAQINIRMDRDENSHMRLTQILDNSGDPILKRASGRLGSMKTFRRLADYDMGNASLETAQKAGMVFLLAAEAIELLDRASSDPDAWEEASEAMREYARNTLRKNV